MRLPPTQYAWTGVSIHGEPVGEHCQKWSTAAFKVTGLVGQVSPASDSEADLFGWGSVAHWTKFASLACSYKRHVYCFED